MVLVETDYFAFDVLPTTDHVLRLWQESLLADDRVAEVRSGSPRDGEEAVTRASEANLVTVLGAWEEGPERASTECDDHPPAIDDGERRLAAVVPEHELGRGGGAAPRRADSAAAADVLGRKTDEYVVDDLLGQVLEQGGTSPVRLRHDRVLPTANRTGRELELVSAQARGRRRRVRLISS
jgi:hypothetical protein